MVKIVFKQKANLDYEVQGLPALVTSPVVPPNGSTVMVNDTVFTVLDAEYAYSNGELFLVEVYLDETV
jgi:hypothetical protein